MNSAPPYPLPLGSNSRKRRRHPVRCQALFRDACPPLATQVAPMLGSKGKKGHQPAFSAGHPPAIQRQPNRRKSAQERKLKSGPLPAPLPHHQIKHTIVNHDAPPPPPPPPTPIASRCCRRRPSQSTTIKGGDPFLSSHTI